MTVPTLVYDGDCPFCANYVALLKLRERWPGLEVLNARDAAGHPALERIRKAGLRIDDGMAIVDGDTILHGAEAMNALSRYGGRLNRAIFSSPGRSRILYPFLKAGRSLALRLLGRTKMGF